MKTLSEKLKTSLLYLAGAIVLAIALPILLENGWASLLGLTAALLFGYQSVTFYKAMKYDNYISVKAECINTSMNDLGAATYAKKCTFKPLDDEPISKEIELQIVNEGSKKHGTKVQTGYVYELIFDKSALKKNPDNISGFNNSTLLAYSVYSSVPKTEKEKEKAA